MLEPAAGVLVALTPEESSKAGGTASAGCTAEGGGTLAEAGALFLACSTGAGAFLGMTNTTVAATATIAKDAANPKRGFQVKNRRRGLGGAVTAT